MATRARWPCCRCPKQGQPQYLNIEFPEPFTAQALTVALDTWNSADRKAALEVSDDGQNYRTIRPLTLRWPVSSVNFEKVTARYFRIVLRPQRRLVLPAVCAMAFRSGRWNCTRTCGSKIFPARQLTFARTMSRPDEFRRTCYRRRWPSAATRWWISAARWTRTGSSLGTCRRGSGRCCALGTPPPGK